ncbi:putative C6 transcription factor [Paecilomyces variotii]|uniref:Putative C6 transcription factor n=1 Tax=Byssochlamys spectabilis TaxID=264951 RepID=A0A443I4Y8_BYSSP|nr:putative C6 transcription factor [Paecilomyces variotii]KAJ9238576.1 transcriptional regulator family: Fungal Specific TF [Paecilomyces variotii]KAJ9255416.1 transcriptional regulator family: Fungal Specific TF [Paecilomyces variotii]KAJ9288520.1 transcriptional regulator family: Fungal Specific TF [Paecilomyces variotii]KAJ9360119.1 transcriptional regulator family: Fungal Specific TF [Paecilomyces variotii]KAJ9360480.1 transcriptional regulator family: Fungal Specific TF [Paecilomyces var
MSDRSSRLDSPLDDTGERPTKKPKRSFVACRRCHSHKIKCSGEQPCHNCRQQPEGTVDCVYPARDRKVLVQESYLRKLEEESQLWKASASPGSTNLPSGSKSVPEDQRRQHGRSNHPGSNEAGEGGPSNPDGDIRNPLIEDRAWFVRDQVSTQPVYIGEAACNAFGTRLRQFLSGDEPMAPLPQSNYVKHKALLRMSDPSFRLPNRTYAHLLIKVALRFLGNDYHLMLRKATLEKLDALYRGQCFDDPILLCRLFAIFAIGELYTNRKATSKMSEVPGTGFFMQAMSLFQDLHEEATVSYIEILVLLSLFCLPLNRTKSAYTFAGIALRLSLTLGLHHNVPEGYMISPVEREHRLRVWWSVYTMDRISSSKLGHPVLVRDEDIDADLPSMEGLSPSEREEFSPPEHLIAHLKLARITGDIISDIYGRPRRSKTFVQSVHMILKDLRSWAETLPENIKLIQTRPVRYASRNVASLHLCFNQCVILTTRPILFHVFRSRFQPPTDGNPSSRIPSPMTSALAEACIHAARSSNSLLTQLWVDGGIATFGYFDSQYLFSSTIILMMALVLRNSESDRDAIETASDILQSMVEDGNLPAAAFYQHLLEIRKCFDFSQEHGKQFHGRLDQTTTGDNNNGNSNGDGAGAATESLPQNEATELLALHTALDDPSIQSFLTQPDIHWGIPGVMESNGDLAAMSRWIFE